MYDRIIVPIDEGAVGLPDQARSLARQLGCELMLLHVHHMQEAPTELEGLPQYRYQGVIESWDERDLASEAHEVEWLAAMAEEVAAGDPDLVVSSRVAHAPLARALRTGGESVLIVASANDVHIDGLSRTVLELLRGGGVPVLMYRPEARLLPTRRMLVALDGSAFSEEVLSPALDLARATGAGLSLVEVVTRGLGLAQVLRPGERSAEAAERFLREVRSRIPEEYGSVDVRVVEQGNAAAGIVKETRRDGIDLVAMATHGRGGLRRRILGSVAESVVRGVQVPVLLYRPVGADTGRGGRSGAGAASAAEA